MGLFRKRRMPLDPLVINPVPAASMAKEQDNVPGPKSADLEEIVARAAVLDAHEHGLARTYLAETVGLRDTQLDPNSTTPRLIPYTEPKDD